MQFFSLHLTNDKRKTMKLVMLFIHLTGIIGLIHTNAFAEEMGSTRAVIIHLNSLTFPVKIRQKPTDNIPPDTPGFVIPPPAETAENTVEITIHGEVGAQIFVNGVYFGTIGKNGKATLVLDTSGSGGTKNFAIVLRDASSNASAPLIFSVKKNVPFSLGSWTRTNPGAGGSINMIGATASGVLVAASDLSGVYVSIDKQGNHWQPRGETNGLTNTTHMSALGFHPTEGKTFYVGTGRGLYTTNDLGVHFNFKPFNLPDMGDNNTFVESVVGARKGNNTNIIYVTFHKWDVKSPSRIAKSLDGGLTWNEISIARNMTSSRLRIVKLLAHPKDADIVYAISGKPRWGCSPARGFRSIDGGSHWSLLEDKGSVLDIDVDPIDKNIIYMTTFTAKPCQPADETDFSMEEYILNDGAGALFKSVDQGGTFGNAIFNQTGIISVGVNNPSKIQLVNILTMQNAWWMEDEQENSTGTWESNNGGTTWIHVGSVANWDAGYSTNPYSAFGFPFSGLSKTLTKDIFNSDRLYGSNGWTMGTFDGGRTFKSLSTVKVGSNRWISTGLENINGNALDVNDNNPNVIYFGGYDIGFWVSRDKGLSWKRQYPFKNDLVTQNRYTWGATEDPSQPEMMKVIGGTNVMTLISDPEAANVVWSSFGRAQAFADAVVNLADSTKSDRSGLFRSTDFGDTWTLSRIYNLDGSLLDTHYHAIIYGLSVDKKSTKGQRTLYVTIDGHLARSTDDGRTWHIIRENGGLKYTAVSGHVVYAGGRSGLYRLKGGVWKQMGEDLYRVEMMGVGSPMIRDITPQENIIHYDTNYNEVVDKYAWNGVHDIKIDPANSNIVYVVVYGEGKGLYKTANGGNTWTRINLGDFENRYLRAITIHPQDSNIVFVTSSQNINSGGKGRSSEGIFYTTDGGTSWKEANSGMAWKFGATIEIDNLNERVWAWSPGTGVQYSEINK